MLVCLLRGRCGLNIQNSQFQPDGSLTDEVLERVVGGLGIPMSLHDYQHAADQMGLGTPALPGGANAAYSVQSVSNPDNSFWNS